MSLPLCRSISSSTAGRVKAPTVRTASISIIETRALSTGATGAKAKFFDMKHSNNGARVRLWVRSSRDRVADHLETRTVTYADLQTPEFASINPFRKVPALIRDDGRPIFESAVILDYLEDRYHGNARYVPPTPEGRQEMDLIIRLHDLYVASPNCTLPGFSHSQGAMYLTPVPTEACPLRRVMPDRAVRAAKIAELWNQLAYLNDHIRGPCIMGNQMTLADFTWFPTTIYMEFMLPRVFGWRNVFRDAHILPNLNKWWTNLVENHEEFAAVRQEIWDFWEQAYENGNFDTIQEVVEDKNHQWTYPVQWEGDFPAMLEYQAEPPPDKGVGRYIDQPDQGDLVDEHVSKQVVMHDARQLDPPASLDTQGFTLKSYPTVLSTDDFKDPDLVKKEYYAEVRDLVRELTGATHVGVFDHTLRSSEGTSLNSADPSGEAAPVPRVHCDYSQNSAPFRLYALAKKGELLMVGNEPVEKEVVEEALVGGKRFAFVNVWRSIDLKNPVLTNPLAVCDARSVPETDRILYEMKFPNRRGENYALRHSDSHQWFMYPRMSFDECLAFKVYDTEEPKFVFHTSFTDPRGGFLPPPRKSIEVRTIAIFND